VQELTVAACYIYTEIESQLDYVTKARDQAPPYTTFTYAYAKKSIVLNGS